MYAYSIITYDSNGMSLNYMIPEYSIFLIITQLADHTVSQLLGLCWEMYRWYNRISHNVLDWKFSEAKIGAIMIRYKIEIFWYRFKQSIKTVFVRQSFSSQQDEYVQTYFNTFHSHLHGERCRRCRKNSSQKGSKAKISNQTSQ